MKVEIVKPFRDKETWDRRRVGDTPEMSADRAQRLQALGLVRIVSDTAVDSGASEQREEDDAGDL